VAAPGELVGRRLAAPVPAGGPVSPYELATTPSPAALLRRGERAAEVVASARAADVLPGAHVDVLVTRDAGEGGAELALEDVEVLAARAADAGPGERGDPHVAASLRVTLRQAVYLAAAQSFATELRLLPRAAGDRRHRRAPLAVGDSL
jgi:pilus assembly protein CpaB